MIVLLCGIFVFVFEQIPTPESNGLQKYKKKMTLRKRKIRRSVVAAVYEACESIDVSSEPRTIAQDRAEPSHVRVDKPDEHADKHHREKGADPDHIP